MAGPSLTIKLKDPKKIGRFLSDVQKKQLPFATALAITNTLYRAKEGVEQQLERDIDRPTPFTKRGFRVQKADKRNLTGRLFIMPIQRSYLEFQIFGGIRRPKGTALALPPAKSMPGDVRKDAYGNVPRSQRAKQLLAKGAISTKIGNVAGVWQPPKKTKTGKVRKGSRMALKLAYVKQATYRPRFRFFERGQAEINKHFTSEFQKAFARAMRSAR